MSKAKRYTPDNPVLNTVKTGIKGLLLFLMPIPVLIAAVIHLLKGDLFKSVVAGLLFAGFMFAAIIARHGFKIENRFRRKRLARAPAIPYKTIGAFLLSVTTALTAFLLVDYSILNSLLIAIVTLIGFFLAYGLDPKQDKIGNIRLGTRADEVFEALESAERTIESIEATRKTIRNLEFNQHLQNIVKKAREILKTIEEDPNDLQRARKFLKVYLDGTRRVTESYARTHKNDATTADLDASFRKVLQSIEVTFEQQHKKLQEDDQFDLDVQIEVLRTQLKQEGMF